VNKGDINMTFGTGSGKSALSESSDVMLSSPADLNLLAYDSATAKWKNLPYPNKASIGLGNVDNTSDANKPVSTAQAAAIAATSSTYLAQSDAATIYATKQELAAVDTGGTATAGIVYLDSFSGADDDARLTAALSYAAAQSNIPTIMLSGHNYTFNQGGRAVFSGMKISGPSEVGWLNPEQGGGKLVPAMVTLNVGIGTSAWFNATSTTFDGYIANIGFVSTNGNSQFFSCPLPNSLYCWAFHNLSFQGFKHVLGNPTDSLAITATTISGRWTIVGGSDTQVNIGGSDCDLWTDGSCNFGPDSNSNGAGKYLCMFTSMGKSNVGGMFFTADAGWRALKISGSTNYGPALVLNGFRIEGRNPTDPSYGSLVKIVSSNVMFRDSWIAYAMSNPSAYTDATDAAVIQVSGSGDAIFDGVTYDRSANVGQDVPLFRVESSAKLEVEHVRTCTRGGSWTDLPVVSGLNAVTDSSVRKLS